MRELREERIRSGEIEEIDLSALIERDGGICHICGKKVSDRVKFGGSRGKGEDRTMYPSVDHIVPISRGGEHVWSNVKLAHLSCNAKKGAKMQYTP